MHSWDVQGRFGRDHLLQLLALSAGMSVTAVEAPPQWCPLYTFLSPECWEVMETALVLSSGSLLPGSDWGARSPSAELSGSSGKTALSYHLHRARGDLRGSVPSRGTVTLCSPMSLKTQVNQLLPAVAFGPTSLYLISFYFEWLPSSAPGEEWYKWKHEFSFTKSHWNKEVYILLIITGMKIMSIVLITMVS